MKRQYFDDRIQGDYAEVGRFFDDVEVLILRTIPTFRPSMSLVLRRLSQTANNQQQDLLHMLRSKHSM
jgi:hypothetical protein